MPDSEYFQANLVAKIQQTFKVGATWAIVLYAFTSSQYGADAQPGDRP